tara:strand:+ start:77 stop:271 length:195 start_codon:yes stop_codon:yes gene_type:complete
MVSHAADVPWFPHWEDDGPQSERNPRGLQAVTTATSSVSPIAVFSTVVDAALELDPDVGLGQQV